jgi:hypothetical protein
VGVQDYICIDRSILDCAKYCYLLFEQSVISSTKYIYSICSVCLNNPQTLDVLICGSSQWIIIAVLLDKYRSNLWCNMCRLFIVEYCGCGFAMAVICNSLWTGGGCDSNNGSNGISGIWLKLQDGAIFQDDFIQLIGLLLIKPFLEFCQALLLAVNVRIPRRNPFVIVYKIWVCHVIYAL